jgi:hypothetical protein
MANLFDSAVSRIRTTIPKFGVRYKDESWTSKLLAVLVWIFNRTYMTTYTTTRYPLVYFPSREFVESNPKRAVKILAHEFVHLWDRKYEGLFFSFSYAMPQLLALVFLALPITLIFFKPWWVVLITAIPAIVCAMPIPSYWRMKWEMRGYSMSMAMNYWRYGSIQDSTIKHITSQFTGWPYYKMWPFKEDMRLRMKQAVIDIESGSAGQPFTIMKDFVEEHEAELK